MVLGPKHLKAIELLASTDLMKREIAAAAGVSTETLCKWGKDPAFREELSRQRDHLPHRMHALRIQAARLLLLDVIWRLRTQTETLPLKEETALLERLVGSDFSWAALVAPAEAVAPETPEPVDEAQTESVEVQPLTTEEAEAIWAVRAAQGKLEEVRSEQARRAQNSPHELETPISAPEAPSEHGVVTGGNEETRTETEVITDNTG